MISEVIYLGVQLDTSPIARGYRKLFRAIRIFAFVARLAIRKEKILTFFGHDQRNNNTI